MTVGRSSGAGGGPDMDLLITDSFIGPKSETSYFYFPHTLTLQHKQNFKKSVRENQRRLEKTLFYNI